MELTDRIGSRLKLRDFHIVLAVAEWRSMAKAARHLAVSHPVVSRAIAELERELGVRLFDRTPQGVEPTVYGRTVLNRGFAVFDELRGTVKDIQFLSDPTTGELRIGTNTAASALLAMVLDKLSFQRPRITFRVKLGDAPTLHYHDLRERNVDLLFGRVVELDKEDVNAEVLFHDRLYVYAHASNPWTRRRKTTLKELVHEPWVVPPPDTYAGALFADAFTASDLPIPHITVASHGMVLQNELINTGRFLSVLPWSFLKFSGKPLGLKILPIELPIQPRPVGIVTLKNRTLSPVAKLFMERAREVTKSLGKEKK